MFSLAGSPVQVNCMLRYQPQLAIALAKVTLTKGTPNHPKF